MVRSDLKMAGGRAAAQAGHAFLESYLSAMPDLQDAYRRDGGTKVVLTCADEGELRRLHDQARHRGLPCALILEDDMPAPRAGEIVVTALGIGPAPRGQVRPITQRLKLME